MRLIITGHKFHGKNTVCEILSSDFTSVDSSRFACEHFLFDMFQERGILYDSVEDCFKDRINNRALWYNSIREWNGDRPERLAEAIFAEHDIYNGMRHVDELNAARAAGLFDYLVWVDSSERLPPETNSSMSITKDMADYVIDNNGGLRSLIDNAWNMILELSERIRHERR